MVSAEFYNPAAVPTSIQDAKVSGKGLENGMASDEFVWFFISNLNPTQQKKLNISIKYEQGNYDIPYSIFSTDQGLHRVSYKRDSPGNYQIDATTLSDDGRNTISILSTLVKVDGDFDLGTADLQDHFIHCFDPDKTAVFFEQNMYSFYIQTRNWRNGPIKEGGIKFSADMKFLLDKSDVPIELIDLKDGNYRINFQPIKSGRYSLDIGLVANGRYNRIKGSPFECSLLLGNHVGVCIDPSKTKADWSKFRHRTANDLIRFLIEAVDQKGLAMHTGGAVFDAKVSSPHSKEDIPIIIVDHEDGSYIGSFKPKLAGSYTINVCVKNEKGSFEHISASPFNFSVAQPDLDLEPNFTIASGPGLVGGKPGKFTNFTIRPKNSKNQPVLDPVDFSVKIIGPAGKEISADITDNSDGSYRVSYCPLIDGKHTITVHLTDSKGKKLPIKGSPFIVDIDPSIHLPYANNCNAYGMGMVSAKVGQDSNFFIQARNKSRQEIPAKVTDFCAHLESEDGVHYPLLLSENQDGTITASYNVTKPGYYTGFVFLTDYMYATLASKEDRYISCTPFMVEVVDKVDPSKTEIRGLEKTREFGISPTTFTIITKNPRGMPITTGGESFDLKIEAPNDSLVSAGFYDHCDGTYDVTFRPMHSGIHSIWLFYDGCLIAGCPYQIDVEDVADAAQSVTSKYMFVVQMRTKDGRDKDTGGDFFEVNITGPDGNVGDVQIVDVGDGSLLVQYSLVKPGEYWVKAVLNSKPLHGFPILHIIPPK